MLSCRKSRHYLTVIPAQAEVLFNSEAGQSSGRAKKSARKLQVALWNLVTYVHMPRGRHWIPACAGMTVRRDVRCAKEKRPDRPGV
jgi:hypothetical protein